MRTTHAMNRSEKGTTLIEVSIVSLLLVSVLAVMFGILISLTKTERRTQALVSNEQETRFVVTELVRDIRAANPLEAYSITATDYTTQIEMRRGPLAGPQTRIRWRYDVNPASATYRSLIRETLDAAGNVTSSNVRLRSIRNVDKGLAMFSYYSQTGTDLVAAGIGNNVGNCAIHVEVVITADSNPGPEPFTVRSDAEVRNRLPGGVGCG